MQCGRFPGRTFLGNNIAVYPKGVCRFFRAKSSIIHLSVSELSLFNAALDPSLPFRVTGLRRKSRGSTGLYRTFLFNNMCA